MAIVLGMNCTGYWFYMLAYNIMPPRYKDCVYSDPQPLDPVASCTYDNICADNSKIISAEIDWSNIYSLHNWF